MNNVEITEDFLKTFKEAYPDIILSEKESMLINMAVNHACLLLNREKK